MTGKPFWYKGKQYPVMDLEDASNERERRVKAGGKNVCIVSCSVHGGGADEYIVVIAERPTPFTSEVEEND